jgi:hypothetical protein
MASPATEIDCPWCGEAHSVEGVHEIDTYTHIYKTVLFCPACRRLVKVQGKYPRDGWAELAAYVAPRLARRHCTRSLRVSTGSMLGKPCGP